MEKRRLAIILCEIRWKNDDFALKNKLTRHFEMNFYRFPLTFIKGSSIIPLCEGSKETEYTLCFEENGILGDNNGRRTCKILILKQIGLVIERAEICLWP